jgi:fumarate reductase subunit D
MSGFRQGPRNAGHRRDLFRGAAMVHRISGVLLACFLPLHFLVLGLTIEHTARLDDVLRWTSQPMVKLAEAVLVFLLAVHLLGGIRVLLIENFPWRPGRDWVVTAAIGASGLLAMLFILRAQ